MGQAAASPAHIYVGAHGGQGRERGTSGGRRGPGGLFTGKGQGSTSGSSSSVHSSPSLLANILGVSGLCWQVSERGFSGDSSTGDGCKGGVCSDVSDTSF